MNPNATMTFMTKSSSQFSKPSNIGNITLRALDSRSMLSPITRTSNTFPQPRSLRAVKHIGLNTFPVSTSLSVSNLQNFRPVFTSKQLAPSLRATTLSIPVLRGLLIMDTERLHSNIRSHLQDDPVSAEHPNQSDPK